MAQRQPGPRPSNGPDAAGHILAVTDIGWHWIKIQNGHGDMWDPTRTCQSSSPGASINVARDRLDKTSSSWLNSGPGDAEQRQCRIGAQPLHESHNSNDIGHVSWHGERRIEIRIRSNKGTEQARQFTTADITELSNMPCTGACTQFGFRSSRSRGSGAIRAT